MTATSPYRGRRLDTLRHKVGQCPSCRAYIWATVDVESTISEPTLDQYGKPHAYGSARIISGFVLHHKCEAGDKS